MAKLRLLCICSWEFFCEGLVNRIRTKAKFDVISVPNVVSKAVEAARIQNPHVVLTDIESPGGSNIELIHGIHQVVPDARIIVFTHSTSTTEFFSAVQAGATAYISKNNSLESLVADIELVANGALVVDPPIAIRAIAALQSLHFNVRGAKTEHISLLTNQERRILAVMAQYYSNKEIADALFISESTVKVHVHSIMQKLSAHSRLEAMACGIEEGLQFRLDGTWPEQVCKSSAQAGLSKGKG